MEAKACWPIFVALACLMTASCEDRVVSSQPITGSPLDTRLGEAGGLIYSLPKTIVSVTGSQDAHGQVTYGITPTIMPDSRARFRLRYAASSFSDDSVDLQVDKNGLLTSTKGDITDRTGAIVAVLAKTAAAVAFPPPGAAAPPGAAPKPPSPYPFTVIYELEDLGSVRLPDGAQFALSPWASDRTVPVPTECDYSVCFRGVEPIKGTITLGTRRTDFAFIGINPFRIEGLTYEPRSWSSAKTRSHSTMAWQLSRALISQAARSR